MYFLFYTLILLVNAVIAFNTTEFFDITNPPIYTAQKSTTINDTLSNIWSIDIREPKISTQFSDNSLDNEITIFYKKITKNRNHRIYLMKNDCIENLTSNVLLISNIYDDNNGNLDLNINVDTENINTNEEIYFNNEQNPRIEFCVRAELYIKPNITVTYLETVVIIYLDLTLGFNNVETVIVEKEADSVVTDIANIDYSIDACTCNTDLVIPNDLCENLDKIDTIFQDDPYLGICLNTNSDQVEIFEIKNLDIEQDGFRFGPKLINNGEINELVDIIQSRGLSTMGRNIVLDIRLVDDFFRDELPKNLSVFGNVEVKFRDSNRRFLLNIDRILQVDENNLEDEEFNLEVSLEKKIEVSTGNYYTINNIYYYLASIFYLFA